MKKKRCLLLLIFFFCVVTFTMPVALAKDGVLQAGVTWEARVPNSFMGTWRVTSHLKSSGTSSIFKLSGVDLWNLSRAGHVINLNNPFTGASASITVNYVDGKTIKFSKQGNYDDKILTDIVELQLSGDRFTGTNTLKLDTLSNVDRHVVKTETAQYSLYGEKISGMSINGK